MSVRRRIAGRLPGILVVALLAGCATPTVEPDLGHAVKRNRAAHLVNTAPAPLDLIGQDGARAALAIERYKAGQVIPPAAEAIDQQLK
jgi:hypothetical protein